MFLAISLKFPQNSLIIFFFVSFISNNNHSVRQHSRWLQQQQQNLFTEEQPTGQSTGQRDPFVKSFVETPFQQSRDALAGTSALGKNQWQKYGEPGHFHRKVEIPGQDGEPDKTFEFDLKFHNLDPDVFIFVGMNQKENCTQPPHFGLLFDGGQAGATSRLPLSGFTLTENGDITPGRYLIMDGHRDKDRGNIRMYVCNDLNDVDFKRTMCAKELFEKLNCNGKENSQNYSQNYSLCMFVECSLITTLCMFVAYVLSVRCIFFTDKYLIYLPRLGSIKRFHKPFTIFCYRKLNFKF